MADIEIYFIEEKHDGSKERLFERFFEFEDSTDSFIPIRGETVVLYGLTCSGNPKDIDDKKHDRKWFKVQEITRHYMPYGFENRIEVILKRILK